MKNPALQQKSLYSKDEVEYSHRMAIYQGMAMVFVALSGQLWRSMSVL